MTDEQEVTRIAVTVTVDTDDLRKWAEWHADRGHHGVAHVLYKAASEVESLSKQALAEAWSGGRQAGLNDFMKRTETPNPHLSTRPAGGDR